MPAQNDKPVQQDNDTTRRELAQFDQFLDGHREIAEQVRKDPSLLDNKNFVTTHPALQTYLQDHPGVREEIKENPDAFMRQEKRFDRVEDGRDRDANGRQMASFGDFLDHHSSIAKEMSKDPSLAKNPEYVKNHPELQEYLNAHPDVQEQLTENPQSFFKGTQEFRNNSNGSLTNGSTSNGSSVKTPASIPDPKPKQ